VHGRTNYRMNARYAEPHPPVAKRALLLLVGLSVGLALSEAMLRFSGVVREVGPPFTRYDPVYGKRLRENLRATRTSPEFHIRYSVNSLGFRGPEPERFPEHPILFIGDSFTEGYGVSDGEEYPELIRRALVAKYGQQAPPVVNAGIGNAGTGHWVKLLRLEGRRFAPRLVVLQFTDNDFADNLREGMYLLDSSRQLVELPIPPRGLVHTINEIVAATPGLSRTHLMGLGYQLYHKYNRSSWEQAHPGETSATDDELTYRLWEEALRICHDGAWPVVGIAVEIVGEQLTRLQRMLDAYKAPLIVVPSKQQRPDLYYALDGHWNATGHAYVAQTLERTLNGIPFQR
jgi:GDSL-like lipase/acylhydrolase family protein